MKEIKSEKPTTSKFKQNEELSSIEQLPSEILCPIVKYLPYKDRMNAAEVSQRWHSIVDNLLGRKLFVGRACQFTPDDEERYKHRYVSVTNLGKLGVNSCYIGEVVDPVKSLSNLTFYWTKLKETIFGPNLPKFKHPHMVKNLFFDGPLPSRFFDSIVRPLPNLERLDIHLSALCCLNPANMDFPPLTKLETINIWGHKMTQGLFTQFYSSSKIIGNLLVFLDHNTFPRLQNLAMEYPFDLKEQSGRVTESLLEFLKKHRETIQKFKLVVNLFITEEPSEFDTAEDRLWVMKAKEASKLIKLKHVEMNITSLYRVRLSKIWTAFVESQNALESATVMTFRLDPNIISRVCDQNFRNIKSIGFTRLLLNDNGRFTPVDCSVFENCDQLASLFIEGMPSGNLDVGLTNVHKLPKSLTKLELGMILLFMRDTHYILTQLPNLKYIFLGDCGRQEEFGVSVEAIEEVIRDRKISAVNIYGCINGRIPEEGIGNGNPDNEIRINVRYYGMLELTLNDAGYYEPLPRQPIPEMFVDDLD